MTTCTRIPPARARADQERGDTGEEEDISDPDSGAGPDSEGDEATDEEQQLLKSIATAFHDLAPKTIQARGPGLPTLLVLRFDRLTTPLCLRVSACGYMCVLPCVCAQYTASQLLPAGSRFRADIVGYGTARDEHSTFTCYTVHVTRLPISEESPVRAVGLGSPVGTGAGARLGMASPTAPLSSRPVGGAGEGAILSPARLTVASAPSGVALSPGVCVCV